MRRRRGKRQCIPIRFCRAKLLTCLPPRPPGAWQCGHHETDIGSDQVCILPRHPPTRARISLDTGGRPGFPRRDFHVQKSLNPLRCQPMTVSGLTITRAWRQPGHRQDRMTQKTLSAFRSDGRGLFRFRTATCCRRAWISVWSAARSAKISMILCMPERVFGGDAKFQGFCDRWNKWEGQPDQTDNCLGGSFLHWCYAPSGHTEKSGFNV